MKLKKNCDVFGRELTVGQWIIYGAAKCHCAGLNIGKILAIEKRPKSSWNDSGHSIKIQGIEVSWGEYRMIGMSEYVDADKRKPRPSRLTFPDRICAVPAEWVPDFIKEMIP